MSIIKMNVADVRVIKDLYPRIEEDTTRIQQYRDSIDSLPKIVVARDGVLVDGFHRLQAYKLEGKTEIEAEDLGNISDDEIFNEAIKRNATHGIQLNTKDKKNLARKLWRTMVHLGDERKKEISKVLSIDERSVERYTKEEREEEEKDQKARALDLWLDCHTQEEISKTIGAAQSTINGWIINFRQLSQFDNRPGADPKDEKDWGDIQHFDVWSFSMPKEKNSGYFGVMAPQIVENILWLYTEVGDIVFDPFAGSGTTINVCKQMGRRVWSSDRKPYNQLLPIHQHDIVADGWPKDAPERDVKFILLDPPYWMQAKERYSKDPEDLGNMDYKKYLDSWNNVIKTCGAHLSKDGYLAFIVSPTEVKEENRVVDLAHDMYNICEKNKLTHVRRIIATYSTQQATGQQVNWARENKKLLKLYRDLVVFKKA